jgi:membrane protease YdiL (CAAX protease family)
VAIFVVGTPYSEFTAANDSLFYNGVLVAAFALLALALRGRPSLALYAACNSALLIGATAMLVLVAGPFDWLITAEEGSVQEAFQGKLAEFLAVVPAILVLTLVARRPWGWVFLQKGRPKRWLIFGLSWFGFSAVVIAGLALASGIDAAELLSAAPWIVAFAALNAVMEELWFRGIFLRPYSSAMGGVQAVVVTAFIFAGAHVGATYLASIGELMLLVVGASAIGLVAAWAMRWADALWGSVLFHMGLDLLVVFGLLESV